MVPNSPWRLVISSRICAWTVTSSAVVGSSAISSVGGVDQRHRDHHALAHAARELVRVVVDPPLGAPGSRPAQHLERLARARPSLRSSGGRGSPPRSGRRSGRTGAGSTSGPGRSSPSARRAAPGPRRAGSPTSSCAVEPDLARDLRRPCDRCRPMIACAVTLLPGAGLAHDGERLAALDARARRRRRRGRGRPRSGTRPTRSLTARNGRSRAGPARRRCVTPSLTRGSIDRVEQVDDQVRDDDDRRRQRA